MACMCVGRGETDDVAPCAILATVSNFPTSMLRHDTRVAPETQFSRHHCITSGLAYVYGGRVHNSTTIR